MKLVISSVMEGVGASRKIFEYMHKKPEISYNGAEKKSIEGHVDLVDVTFSYPNRQHRNVLKVRSLQKKIKHGTFRILPFKSKQVRLLQLWGPRALEKVRSCLCWNISMNVTKVK